MKKELNKEVKNLLDKGWNVTAETAYSYTLEKEKSFSWGMFFLTFGTYLTIYPFMGNQKKVIRK